MLLLSKGYMLSYIYCMYSFAFPLFVYIFNLKFFFVMSNMCLLGKILAHSGQVFRNAASGLGHRAGDMVGFPAEKGEIR